MSAFLLWRLELRLLARDRAALTVLLLWCAGLAYALSTGWQLAEARRTEVAAFETQALARLDKQRSAVEAAARAGRPPDRFAAFPSQIRLPAVLPVAPLAMLTVGEMDLRPHTATISLFTSPSAASKNQELQSAATLALGRLDLGFAVVALLPLVLIALIHPLRADDREQQRLPLLAAQGARTGLFMRRLTLRLSLALLPLWVLTLAAALWVRAPLADWGMWAGVTLAYAGFWTLLAAAVAWRAERSGPAAALLIALWLLIVLLLPAALNAALQQLAPPPSALREIGALRAAQVEADRQREAILGAYVSDHPELQVNTAQDDIAWTRNYWAQLQFVERALLPVRAEAQTARERQLALQQRLRWLSPAGLAERALARAADTDAGRFDAWQAQLNDFKPRWDAQMLAPLMRGESLDAAAFVALPRFQFQPHPAEP